MLAGKKSFVSAIRRNIKSIDYFEVSNNESNLLKKLQKTPFIKEFFSLVQANSNSVKYFDFASIVPSKIRQVF